MRGQPFVERGYDGGTMPQVKQTRSPKIEGDAGVSR